VAFDEGRTLIAAALFASHPPLCSMFQMLIDQRLRVAADDAQTDVPDLGRSYDRASPVETRGQRVMNT